MGSGTNVYKVGDGYVIARNEVWLPGVYATEQAARYAIRFPPGELQQIQDSLFEDPITLEILKAREAKLAARLGEGDGRASGKS